MQQMDGYEQALKIHPADAEALRGELDAAIAAALTARNSGQNEQALALLLRAHHWVGNDPLLLRDTGVLEEQMKLYKDADDALMAAHTADPHDMVTVYALARAEMDLGHSAASGTWWRTYLAAKPEDASAHYAYGLLLEEANQSEEAAQEFETSIHIQALQVESYYRLGEIRREQGQSDLAAVLYRKALARAPNHAGALTGLGILAFQARQYEQANRYLQQAIAAAPAFQTAHYYHGLTLARLGDRRQAQFELQLAVTLANRQNLQGASHSRQLATVP